VQQARFVYLALMLGRTVAPCDTTDGHLHCEAVQLGRNVMAIVAFEGIN
jgi:hypothetical protein